MPPFAKKTDIHTTIKKKILPFFEPKNKDKILISIMGKGILILLYLRGNGESPSP